MYRLITVAGIAWLTLAGIAQADIISERKAGFKGNVTALKQIKGALGNGDLDTVVAAAMSVADWSSRMTEYFPEGSDQGNTNARAEIWFEFEDFTNRAKAAETAAIELADLARGGHQDKLMDGLQKLSGTCKACHSSYKN